GRSAWCKRSSPTATLSSSRSSPPSASPPWSACRSSSSAPSEPGAFPYHRAMNLFVRWAVITLALYLTVRLGVGLSMPQDGLGPLLVTAAVIGLVNALIRPLLVLLTLPFTVITFGLFLLVVNALAL